MFLTRRVFYDEINKCAMCSERDKTRYRMNGKSTISKTIFSTFLFSVALPSLLIFSFFIFLLLRSSTLGKAMKLM